jgi:hypothetical protein
MNAWCILTLVSYADMVPRIIPATSSREWAEYLPSPTFSSLLVAEALTFDSAETWEDWKSKIHKIKTKAEINFYRRNEQIFIWYQNWL